MVLFSDMVVEAGRVFCIPPRDLLGRSKMNYLIPARHGLFAALYARWGSYKAVGRKTGRDHATIIHAVKRARERMENDDVYAQRVEYLINYGKPNLPQPPMLGAQRHIVSQSI